MATAMSRRVGAALLLTVTLLAGCGPEASRGRGQRGADIGNRDPNEAVELHGRTDPSWSTPILGRASELGGAARTENGDGE